MTGDGQERSLTAHVTWPAYRPGRRELRPALTPALLLVIWGVLRFAPKIDPRRDNYDKFAAAYDITVAAVLALIFAIHLMMLALGLGYHLPVARIAPALIGALFVIIGNVMPLARSNFVFGIRTPWTLSNDRVWARTHRLAGYTLLKLQSFGQCQPTRWSRSLTHLTPHLRR